MSERKTGPQGRFSIRDLMILMAVVAVLLALLLPWVVKARERARRMECSGRLKLITLALHNYHSVHKSLPTAMGGTSAGPSPVSGNAGRLSGVVGILPFMDQQNLYDTITRPLSADGNSYPVLGPVPWDKNYPPWRQHIRSLRCPTDSSIQSPFGATSYVFSVGDLTTNLHAPASMDNVRGVFAPGHTTRFRDILDGLARTIMVLETATKQGNSTAGQFVVDVPSAKLKVPRDCYQFVQPTRRLRYSATAKLSDLGRGGNWADGAGGYALGHTILPPNAPSCAIEGTAEVDGIYSASSRHPGGCYVAMSDGAVIFLTNSIDTGDLGVAAPTAVTDQNGKTIPSPYGVWGMIGTRSGKEGWGEARNYSVPELLEPYMD